MGSRRPCFVILTCILTVMMSLGAAMAAAPTTISIDFNDPDAMKMIQIPFDTWNFVVTTDPLGDQALFIPQGSEDQRVPASCNTYGSMRFFLLDVPDLDDFELTWEVMGGFPYGENRSHAIIAGYQDIQNWYLVYLTYTDTTRIGNIVNGKEQAVVKPQVANLWPKNMTDYHQMKFSVTTEGNQKVFRTFIDGVPVGPIDNCSVPIASYKPGRVGIGGLAYSTVQAMYIKNIKLTILP